jgi:ABC-type transport system involved in cytochrome c biogenesis permease subunit
MLPISKFLAGALALLAALPCARAAQEDDPHHGHMAQPTVSRPARSAPWEREVVALFAELPVQDGGRVKPLSTYAGFQLLRLNGKRSVKTPSGEKLDPTEWLLDVLFHPDQAQAYQCFQVRNSAVLHAAGLETDGKRKSDRYTYTELAPCIDRLFELAQQYDKIESKNHTAEQRDTVLLAHNLATYETLAHFLDFADHRFATAGSEPLRALFGADQVVGVSSVLAKVAALREQWLAVGDAESGTRLEEKQALAALLSELEALSAQGRLAPALVPPDSDRKTHAEWLNPGDVVVAAFMAHPPAEGGQRLLAALEGMVAALGDAPRTVAAARDVHAAAVAPAERRGEYAKIPAEVTFYKGDFFLNALVFFLLGFLLVAVSWLTGPNRWLTGATWLASIAGGLLVVVGVAFRCYLRGRPPVSTLYETILFITGGIVVCSLFIEWINRQRVMLALTPIVGAMGMFLANKYELREAATSGDTMPSLVAVLDTNFWLSTHVTSITLGYAAGLLAAAISHVWLLCKLFGLKRGNDAFYRSITRMVYGVVAFGLVFSVVGTILGGIWANYSWGRFWGWDPKENGALLICLTELFILHARLGGYVKQHGLHVLSVILGSVVAFSWWGVNQLGVGLHSYGFTEGIMRNLVMFWALELLLLLASGAWKLGNRTQPTQPADVAAQGS